MKTCALLCLAPAFLHAAEESRDIDHDGRPERLVSTPGKTEICNADDRPSLFQLPEGFSFLDAPGIGEEDVIEAVAIEVHQAQAGVLALVVKE